MSNPKNLRQKFAESGKALVQVRDALISFNDSRPHIRAFLEKKEIASTANLDDKGRAELFTYLQDILKLIHAEKATPAKA